MKRDSRNWIFFSKVSFSLLFYLFILQLLCYFFFSFFFFLFEFVTNFFFFFLIYFIQGVDGYQISKQERDKMRESGIFKESLTYGEINIRAFYSILCKANMKENTLFVDMGCGTGKAVFLAALCFPVIKSLGIEILEVIFFCFVFLFFCFYLK